MSTFEIHLKCTSCPWEGRRVKEYIGPMEPFQRLTSLIAASLSEVPECPDCGGEIIPTTKQMVG